MFDRMDAVDKGTVIKVLGLGGGGGNAVQYMHNSAIRGISYLCIGTDAQALEQLTIESRIHIGRNITRGLGAGGNPDIGRQAALEDRDRIEEEIDGSDILFITAGMGGGICTGASPVVAQAAKEMGILTIGVVTSPFRFEGSRRNWIASQGVKRLAEHVDSLITIPAEKVLAGHGMNISLIEALDVVNAAVSDTVRGITDLITSPGHICMDISDVRRVMSEAGWSRVGFGSASGNDRSIKATRSAIASPLLEDNDLMAAEGILVNITVGPDLGIDEFEEVCNTVRDSASEDATVVVGTVIDPDMRDELRVTVVATGLDAQTHQGGDNQSLMYVNRSVTADENYDQPTVIHKKSRITQRTHVDIGKRSEDMDYLDTPAFMRRQADDSENQE